MTTEYAEGSGSSCQDLAGDPRIVPFAEVLVGARAASGWSDESRSWLGARGNVVSIGHRHAITGAPLVLVSLPGDRFEARHYEPRDLVCVRTADAKLTDEGVALLKLDAACYPDVWAFPWLERARIIRYPHNSQTSYDFHVDRAKLNKALGRPAPVPIVTYSARYAGLDDKTRHYSYTPETIGMCANCGKQIRREGSPRCADCDQALGDAAPDYHEQPRPDYSGEAHNRALSAWLHRPMGTQ